MGMKQMPVLALYMVGMHIGCVEAEGGRMERRA